MASSEVLTHQQMAVLAHLDEGRPREPLITTGDGLYRIVVSVAVQDRGLVPTYLVRSESPAAAAALAVDRSAERWPHYREIKVLRCWSFPPGEIALSGAEQLELVGAPVEVADVGPLVRA
jgi:hypothetical protein